MALGPNDKVDRYVIESLLGAGGMGEVYAAYDTRLQRRVAIKVLRAERHVDGTPGSSNARDRFLREARAVAAFDHPNVVDVYDVGHVPLPDGAGETTFIAMELVKGESLRVAARNPNVSIDERLRWLRDVAGALDAAHAAGIVHRDVKPDNVMLRDDGVIKVLDFGIAKPVANAETLATLTAEGTLLGTPLYMAPEQIRGEPLDGRADQFAWGVMAYELVVGKSPWTTENGAFGVAAQILLTEPEPISGVAGVPAHVARTVERALAKNRDARFRTMGELALALDAAPAVLAASDRPGDSGTAPATNTGTTSVEVRSEEVVRKPSRWGVRAGLVAVALGVGAGIFLAARSHGSPHGAASFSAAIAAPECTSNRACVEAHGGEPYVCRPTTHTCAAVASPDCQPLFEPRDLVADDTLWLGVLLPKTGPAAAAYGVEHREAAELARLEIASATGVLDGKNGSFVSRPVALVTCDDAVDAWRAATHLVDDVGVPAVLGFGGGKEAIKLASTMLIPRGVLSVSTLSSSPQITRLPQPPGPRMVWNTVYDTNNLAEATAKLITSAVEPLAAKGHRPTRVVLIRDAGTWTLGFAETLFRDLVFNGRSAVDNGDGYQEFTMEGKASPDSPEIGPNADRVVAAAPTIIVAFTSDWTPSIAAIEARLPRGAPRPIYVLPNSTLQREAGDEERSRSFLIMNDAGDGPANAHFVMRYNDARLTTQVTRISNPGATYDAVYLLTYAAFASPPGPLSGQTLATAFSRLVPPGPPIELGPAQVLEALATLHAGKTIAVFGTSGPLDFDLTSGEVSVDFALRCDGTPPGAGMDADVESGVVYRAATKTVEGTFHCARP